MPKLKYASGFTLIELLIVIVIIGILAAAVIVVIDPASQQQKAKEAVVRANVEKGCLAMMACHVLNEQEAYKCDSKGEVGIRGIDGNPAGSRYVLTNYWGNTTDSAESPVTTQRALYYKGIVGLCEVMCYYVFNYPGGYPSPAYSSVIDDGGYRWVNPLWIKDTCLIQ